MDPIVWILIIGLVVVIAVGAWLLTRKPSAPDSGASSDQGDTSTDVETRRADEVERYDVGGDHVAAGDASTSDEVEPYDQEAEQDEDPPVWQGEETAGQDTATGGDVPVVDDEPSEGAHEQHTAPPPEPADTHGDREQMTYPEAETEDFASETTYADPEQHTGPAPSAEPGTSRLHHGEGSENVGPEEGEGDAGEDADQDRGHPGPVSQRSGEGSYDPPMAANAGSENVGPESGEGDPQQVADADRGHPGPLSQGETEADYAVPEQTDDIEHDDVPGDAHAAGFADVDSDATTDEPRATGPADEPDMLSDGPTAEPDVVIVESVEVAEVAEVEQEPAGTDDSTSSGPVVVEAVETDAIVVTPVEEETVEGQPVDEEGGSGHGLDDPLAAEAAPADVHPAALGETREDADEHDQYREPSGGGATVMPAAGSSDAADQAWDSTDRDREADGDEPLATDHSHEDSELTTAAAPVGESVPLVIDDDTTDGDRSRVEQDEVVVVDEPVEPEPEMPQQRDLHERPDEQDQPQDREVGGEDRAEHEEASVDSELDERSADEHVVDERPADGPSVHESPDNEDRTDVAREDGQVDESDVRGDETVAGEPAADTATEDTTTTDTTAEDTAEVEVVEGPYGPGSAMPAEDGSHPEGYEIKGNAGSMLFHTPESPVYEDYSPDVWFDSEASAKDAGFAHWDRKRR